MAEKYERDIVCGMYLINPDDCKVSEYKGQIFYFCCNKCKDEFEKDKTKFVEMNNSHLAKMSNQKKMEMERDPVCGQMIKIKDAKGSSLFKNNKYFFCCITCKKVFDNNPSVYADKEEGYYDPNNPNDIIDGTFRIL